MLLIGQSFLSSIFLYFKAEPACEVHHCLLEAFPLCCIDRVDSLRKRLSSYAYIPHLVIFMFFCGGAAKV